MRRAVAPWAPAAIALWAGTLALFWPGYALYDSVAQYQQALSGRYDDWHPPIMAMLWRGLHATAGGGTGPMLAMQLAGWWLGLGLIAAALARGNRPWAAAAVLAIGAMPPWLGWQVAILKDAQMASALLAAAGLIAWRRLQGRQPSRVLRLLVAVLLGYAALVRANAIFAVAPLIVMLIDATPARRSALAIGLVAATLAVAGPVNHRLIGAEETSIARTQAIFDLAGMAVRVPDTADLPLTAAERRPIVLKRCATPYFWDPLGTPARCGGDLARLQAVPVADLYRSLALAIAAHPVAYARARLSHLNSTERWLVPRGWPGAAPPNANEPNMLGLEPPGRAAARAQAVGGRLAETPLGWPICWSVLAVAAAIVAMRRPQEPARDLALALAFSALGQEASFAIVSIASDWRYHLWATVATALACVLLADRRPSRRTVAVAGGVLVVVLVGGTAARLLLPLPPQTYAGMLASGARPMR